MKLTDLGIDPKTGVHHPTLTACESTLLGILWVDHVGQDNRITADVLAVYFFTVMKGVEVDHEALAEAAAGIARFQPATLAGWKRDIRTLHNHLLIHHPNVPLLSAAGPRGGYWMAETEAEAKAFYATFRRRGMTGLVKASRGKKAVLADIVQQLTFEFEDLAGDSPDADVPGSASAPIEVVDALLEKMTRNPERFAGELRRLGEKFGSVLLPKDQVQLLTAKAAELQALVAGMSV